MTQTKVALTLTLALMLAGTADANTTSKLPDPDRAGVAEIRSGH
jgi:hypothetical protein